MASNSNEAGIMYDQQALDSHYEVGDPSVLVCRSKFSHDLRNVTINQLTEYLRGRLFTRDVVAMAKDNDAYSQAYTYALHSLAGDSAVYTKFGHLDDTWNEVIGKNVEDMVGVVSGQKDPSRYSKEDLPRLGQLGELTRSIYYLLLAGIDPHKYLSHIATINGI